MKDTTCSFDRREEALIAFVYGEIGSGERERLERHLLDCAACRGELDALTDVRADLAGWASPEPAAGVGGQTARAPWRVVESLPASRSQTKVPTFPVWLEAAAALFFCAAALGAANLHVSYSPDAGLSVRTGWLHEPAAPPAEQPVVQRASEPAAVSPWQRDLASLEAELRAEIKAEVTALDGVDDGPDDEAVLRRVRALIVESERRQQRELALRVAEIARDAQIQRQADLVKIERSLGLIQSRTGVEVMRTQQQLNSLAQRVSQRP
ncbi:MAG: anti-sigma factor [Vicinamibacterales bacterium]